MTMISDKESHPDIEDILDFWHKCEFFLPFDLQRAVLDVKKEDKWSIKSLELSELSPNNTSIWNFSPPPEKEIVGFDMYIGVFDKSAIADRVQKVLGASEDLEAIEEDELRKLEGPTCMARIGVNNNGEPTFSSVAISTVSWALGSCRENLSLDKLDIDNFEDDVRWLKQSLLEFNHDTPSDSESGQPNPLRGSDLLRILEIFVTWSKEWPGPVSQAFSKGPVLVIKAKAAKPRKQAQVGNKESSAKTVLENSDETDEEEVDIHPQSDADIDILNSFYARDIARVIRSVRQGSKAGLVSTYLSKPDIQKRVDLYTPEGLQKIMEGLEPSRLPSAHWPSDPLHAMSLMQQFALNTLLGTLHDGDIFSINGPPGTGKTTLLRDVFSELMTRRARVLSRLAQAKDAFLRKIKIEFDNGQETSSLNLLNDDLTGYEMVVVSSNNAAVENLSKDIPKASAIGEFWRAQDNDTSVSYLQQVAHNIASRRSNGKYEKLKPDNVPWGLFAAALGRSQNRRHFQSGLQFDGTPSGKSQERKLLPNYDPDLQQSIWNWRKRHKSISFESAKKAFIKADKAVAERIANLENYKKLHTSESNLSEKDFCLSLQQAFDMATLTYENALMEFSSIEYKLNKAESQLNTLSQREELIIATSPRGFFEKLLKKEEKKKCDKALSDIRNLKEGELKKIYDLRNSLEEAKSKLATTKSSVTTTRDNLAAGQISWREKQDEICKLRALFPSIRFPSDEVDLEQDNWQTDGLWYDANLNRLRSELFAAAMTLHEEWLYEVTQNNGGFGGNLVAITKLLGGGRLNNPKEDALPIWQSLFMVVPVISSTFASIATQFRDLGESSLGVWSRDLVVHYFHMSGRMRYGPGSPRKRHDDSGSPSS
ncbi:DEAD/DEAH box helicase family protein, partial [Gluconacetobacter diazotrophicus]|uniref:helicase n=1 Tax=Gluconacetobacter diazotrophicus TaxID=33996 RepID=UPI0021805831